jgi:hypothetical protein
LTCVAGDTISWLIEHTEYVPADGWTLSYALRGEKGDGYLNVTALPSGTSHLLTIPIEQSATMRPGIWHWAAYASRPGERYTVGAGYLTVKPNLAAMDYTADLRSDKKKAYDNAMAAWNTVNGGQSVSLNGRVWTGYDLADLKIYVDDCRSAWEMEQQAQLPASATAGDPRKIYVHLVRP